MGYISTQLSDSNGEFTSPIQITRTYNGSFTAPGISLTFDTYNGVYPSEVNALSTIARDNISNFTLLEINAGSGNFLSMVKYIFPNATVIGTSAIEGEIKHGVKSVQLIKYNPASDSLNCQEHSIDYIIVRAIKNSSGFLSPEEAKELYKDLVKEGGKLLYITD